MDDDLDYTEIARLRAGNAELQRQLQMLQIGLASYQAALEAQNEKRYQALQQELDTWRVMSKFSRRTWFEVMAWIALASLLVNDVAREYATSGWWGLLLPFTQHGAGDGWEYVARGLGLCWQMGLCWWLMRRSQVPKEMEWYLPKTAMSVETYLEKYGDSDQPAYRQP